MTNKEAITELQETFNVLDRTIRWYHGIEHDFKIGENEIRALENARSAVKISIEALQSEVDE